jgi:gamma-glutamyltranspeptidase/glutathione hydrolase
MDKSIHNFIEKGTTIDQFNSRRSTVHCKNGIVATSQPLASEAGIEILRNGGNAFDAAVATAAALNVVEPPSTGVGGDAFALYKTAGGDVGALSAGGFAAENATIDAVNNSEDNNVSHPQGAQSVTVPGAASGWEKLVDELGATTLDTVLQPAIDYAIDGFPVSEVISHLWAYGQDRLANDAAREEYLLNGRAPRNGEVMTLPNLGHTFEKIAKKGTEEFYTGDIANEIVNTVQSEGGFLSLDDLAEFEAEFTQPISTTYNGAEVYELPANNQGPIALEALNIASELDIQQYSLNSIERVHHSIEAMKRAFTDGHQYIADPEFVDIPPLVSKEFAVQHANDIGPTASSDLTPQTPNASDTVLLTVADGAGNVVSFINSLFNAFGSGIAAGDTGILLQSRGAGFSLDPDDPNKLEPRKKPFHTLIPGLVQFDNNDWSAFGVMGASMQPQGHFQVVSNLVDYEMSLQSVLDIPRWRYLSNGEVAIESRFDSEVLSGLFRKGHDVKSLPPSIFQEAPVGHFGGGQIVRNNNGILSGGTDPRKDGSVSGY